MFNKLKIFINVFIEGLFGIKMFYFSSRKDKYGYFSKTSKFELQYLEIKIMFLFMIKLE